MFVNKYSYLPEFLSKEEVEKFIIELINDYNDGLFLDFDFLFYVNFFVYKHQLSLELLNDDVRNKLSCVLQKIWNLDKFRKNNDFRMMEMIFFAIVNLGLQDFYDKIKNDFYNSTNRIDRFYYKLNNFFLEYGDDVSDPYRTFTGINRI